MDATLIEILASTWGKWVALGILLLFLFKDSLAELFKKLCNIKTKNEKAIEDITKDFKESKEEIAKAYSKIQRSFDNINDRIIRVEKTADRQGKQSDILEQSIKVVMKESLISKMNRLINKDTITDEEANEIYDDLTPYLELNGNGSVERKFTELKFAHPEKFGYDPWAKKK